MQRNTHQMRQPGSHGHSIKFEIRGLPSTFTIADIWDYFRTFGGSIEYIGLSRDQEDRAWITFSPPPDSPVIGEEHIVWANGHSYPLRIWQVATHTAFINSPVDHTRQLPTRLMLSPLDIGVGAQSGATDFTIRRIIQNSRISLYTELSSESQELFARFIALSNHSHQPHMLRIAFAYISEVHLVPGPANTDWLLFTFVHPPRYYVGPLQDEPPTRDHALNWTRAKSEHRVTDIDWDMQKRRNTPISLIRNGAFIDSGRWLTWRFSISRRREERDALELLLRMFDDYNVPIFRNATLSFNIKGDKDPSVWSQLERVDPRVAAIQRSLGRSALQELQFPGIPSLEFEVHYQLDVAVSKGLLFEEAITQDFLIRLGGLPHAQELLERFIAADRRYDDPMGIFNIPRPKRRLRPSMPSYCVLLHAVTITPTNICVHPLQVEVSNRVLRRYSEISDRFLRVRFMDEPYYGRLQSFSTGKTEVYERVRRTLINGIRVGGRHFHFLACGNSQFRENGAYFFCPNDQANINSIRQFMGYFQHIREIPKYVSRIGQCFSTTRPITSIGLRPDIVEIPDITRNGHNFSDGVGKMSPFLSSMIARELHLDNKEPSLFQIRMGGCKGTLAVDQTLPGRAVHIRPSQKKFSTDFNQLEIIRVSSFATAYLNKQIILVLSALGIPDIVFLTKLRQQLTTINRAMEDEDAAITMLLQTVDYNQVTVNIATAIAGGLRYDPFIDSLIGLWRAWAIKFLKEKTNLFIPQGAFLLGCVDETASLRMDEGSLPEIFLQIPEQHYKATTPQESSFFGRHEPLNTAANPYRVVEGICILARNPSLHPGDIRIVKAVDCPKLRHLRDVVVVPQLGARPLADMCSGGDLDGDDFLIIWDPDLIPKEQHPPMDYQAPPPILSHGPVTTSDMITFFCEYMRNDSLGAIAVAHRCHADAAVEGVMSDNCLQLAQLHSMAVDYCKTGVPAQMTDELRVKKYPHWAQKPPRRSYRSEGILGQLWDEVERVEFRIDPSFDQTKFDSRIINAYSHSEDFLGQLEELKNEYDENMCRIMAQYGIATEFEVFSAFVMAHNREVKEYKFAEELGGLMSNLKFHYRNLCCEAAGIARGVQSEDIGRLAAAVYTLTAREAAKFAEQDDESSYTRRHTVLISFPWIFLEELTALPHKVTSIEKPSMLEAMADLKRIMKTKRSDMVSQFTRLTNASNLPMSEPEEVDTSKEARQGGPPGEVKPRGLGEDGPGRAQGETTLTAHESSPTLAASSNSGHDPSYSVPGSFDKAGLTIPEKDGEDAVDLPLRPVLSVADPVNGGDAVVADQEMGNNALFGITNTRVRESSGEEAKYAVELLRRPGFLVAEMKEAKDTVSADQEMDHSAPLSTASAIDRLAELIGE